MLGAVRPEDWNLPLFVHVAGAMVLVGALVVVAVASGAALRRSEGAAGLTRLALRTLLLAVIPSFLVMRVAAEWVTSVEDAGDAGWVGFGYGAADGGLLLTVVATVLAWRAARRGDGTPGAAGRAVFVLAVLLLILYAVTIWVMTVKPS